MNRSSRYQKLAGDFARYGLAHPGHACFWTDILNPL
jgi:hypothetical protein